jgi:hypothetical protein
MFESMSPGELLAFALLEPPSAELVGVLARLRPAELDDGLQVDLMVVWERVAAWVAACQQPVVALVGDAAYADAIRYRPDDYDIPFRAAHAEIGAALLISPNQASRRLHAARLISGRLPAVHAALSAGDISYLHARAIAETTENLDDEKALWVAAKVLPKAPLQTLSDLYRALRRAVLAVEPKPAAQRHKEAKAERSLQWWDREDGMAELRLVSTAADVKAAYNAADALAAALPKKDADGVRVPVEARRADALVAAVTGSTQGGRPAAAIQITMDLPTALGLQDNPAFLAGYGPIGAEAARLLAADGKWRRLIYEPLTGALLDLGKTQYEPSAALERFIEVRAQRCSMPGCSQPAHRCELDHTRRYGSADDDGGTDRANLGPLCKNHHLIKHHTGWSMTRDPQSHMAEWLSPTRHTYLVPHHDHRPMLARIEAAADGLTALDPDCYGDMHDAEPPEIDWSHSFEDGIPDDARFEAA